MASSFPGLVGSGFSGYSGAVGPTGLSGTSGTSGFSGVSGWSGGFATGQANPAARVYNSTSTALTTSINNVVPFDSENYDTDNIHDNVTNNSRLTCKTAGIYRISACAFFGPGAGTYRDAIIRLNNTTNIAFLQSDVSIGYALGYSVTTTWQMVVNDYVELLMAHDVGSDILAAAPETHFAMERIRTDGISGYSGYSSQSGVSGISGTSGTSGFSGFSGMSSSNNIVDGRLTLVSGVPVGTDVSSPTSSIYFTPYKGNRISLYNGSYWQIYTFSQLTFSVTGLTSGKKYDLFIYDNSGTLTLERSAEWTNDFARADALTTQDGILVKSGALTRRFVGTFEATSATTVVDWPRRRHLANYYNRVPRELHHDLGDNGNDGGDTFTPANANIVQIAGDFSVEFILPYGEDSVDIMGVVQAYHTDGSSQYTFAGLCKGSDQFAVRMARQYGAQFHEGSLPMRYCDMLPFGKYTFFLSCGGTSAGGYLDFGGTAGETNTEFDPVPTYIDGIIWG